MALEVFDNSEVKRGDLKASESIAFQIFRFLPASQLPRYALSRAVPGTERTAYCSENLGPGSDKESI